MAEQPLTLPINVSRANHAFMTHKTNAKLGPKERTRMLSLRPPKGDRKIIEMSTSVVKRRDMALFQRKLISLFFLK